ncbi:hypothetical protein T484DRAFT_2695306 [Baffinella frigidus]|nr:hypothetical protein T484DRAFT_2695306 [Cryptophyta sp. CCMP2293]
MLPCVCAGDILNTASRFCSSAGPGEVVCSDMFYQRVPRHAWGLIHMGPRPPVTLKGKGQMEVFLLKPGAETHRHPRTHLFFHPRSGLRVTQTFTAGLEGVNFGFRARSGGNAVTKHRTFADPKIWSAHQRGPDRTPVQSEDGAEEDGAEVTEKQHVMDQIHKWWCTLLDPELEALHQGDAFVATESRQAFLVGLPWLSLSVGITCIGVYGAAGRPPGFLLVLAGVVIVASVALAMLA